MVVLSPTEMWLRVPGTRTQVCAFAGVAMTAHRATMRETAVSTPLCIRILRTSTLFEIGLLALFLIIAAHVCAGRQMNLYPEGEARNSPHLLTCLIKTAHSSSQRSACMAGMIGNCSSRSSLPQRYSGLGIAYLPADRQAALSHRPLA